MVGRVIGEVIGVTAAAVPDGLEDLVTASGALAHAVDGHLAGGRAPGIGGVAAVGRKVGAVKVLDRRDVVHHQRLRVAPAFVGVAAGGRRSDIGAVAHHREFHRVAVDGHAILVRMLEPERMADLVQEDGVGVIPPHRIVVIALGLVEPNVAALGGRAGQIGPGRTRRVRHGQAQRGAAGIRAGELGECDVGHGCIVGEGRACRILLRSIQGTEIARRLIRTVRCLVRSGGCGKAVAEISGGPSVIAKYGIRIWIGYASDRGDGGQCGLQFVTRLCADSVYSKAPGMQRRC